MAVATPTRDTTETAAEIIRLIKELPAGDQDRFVSSLEEAIAVAQREGKHRVVFDVIGSYLALVLARRDPDYRKNMARGEKPVGETFTLEEIKQRLQARPAR